MGNFRDLVAWRRGYALALAVYRATERFPPGERFALVSQLRRAATSVISNIAEGTGRHGDREFCRFLRIARCSAREGECQLELAKGLGYLSEEELSGLNQSTAELGRLLTGLIRSLRSRPHPPPLGR